MRAVEGTMEGENFVRLTPSVSLSTARRVVVLILEEDEYDRPTDTMLLSESALAADWNRLEEDAAWSYLQSEM